MSVNRTCDHDALPDLQGIPGLPMDRSVFVIPNWNESFVGMTKCCAPNEVHISGDYGFEGCVLWCLIPDSFLKARDGQKLEEGAVLDEMSYCIRAKTGISRYISGGQVKNNSASSRTTLLGVGVWALLAVGLLV